MQSRPVLHRITSIFTSRLSQNQRLLLSSSALHEASSQSLDAVNITDNCVRKMKELQAEDASSKEKMLRLSVESGGCSGFQYAFTLDDKSKPEDRVFERDGVKLVVDKISFDFVKGATVDYAEELIRAAFQVTTNPSAVGGCSCKSCFMVNSSSCLYGQFPCERKERTEYKQVCGHNLLKKSRALQIKIKKMTNCNKIFVTFAVVTLL